MNGTDPSSGKLNVLEVDTASIKFFVRRSRRKGPYTRLKQSIREVGLRQPINVRDITRRPASERRKPDGTLYTYELVCGQGRLQAFRELEIERIPALIIDVQENEIVGRFLAENVIRKKISWHERAHLIKGDTERGLTIDEVKTKYCITASHAYKYLRILRHASPRLVREAELEKLSVNDAESLTSLKPDEQEIVIEVLKEEGLPNSQIAPLVKKARQLKAHGTISKNALRSTIREAERRLNEVRRMLNLKRIHWEMGPGNLQKLLITPKFRAALDQEGISYAAVMDATQRAQSLSGTEVL